MAITRQKMPVRRGRGHGFTLIELLVVIAIMAIIMLVGLPHFEDIGRGSKMRGAINELRSTVTLARQWAIANRANVYILFPDDFAALFSGVSTNDFNKALHSYAVFTFKDGGVYLKDWTDLPDGVFFVNTYNNQNPVNDARIDKQINIMRKDSLNPIPMPFPYDNSPLKSKQIYVVTFQPDGTMLIFGECEIYLKEGVALEGRAGRVVNVVWKDNPVLWSLKIDPFTGSTKVRDYSSASP